MNTKTKQNQKSQQQKTRQKQEPKKQGQNTNMLHEDRKYQEHEHPEMRLTR
jgi:hypothetical protein